MRSVAPFQSIYLYSRSTVSIGEVRRKGPEFRLHDRFESKGLETQPVSLLTLLLIAFYTRCIGRVVEASKTLIPVLKQGWC